MLRWHHTDQNVGPVHRRGQIVAGKNRVRNASTWKESVVHMFLIDGLTNFRLVRPDPDTMRPFAAKNGGEPSAPCTSPDDRDAAHSGVLILTSFLRVNENR